MYIFLGILAAVAMAGVIYLFLSKKSSKLQKLAALGVLVLNCLVLAVCGIIVVTNIVTVQKDDYAFPLIPEEPKPAAGENYIMIIIFLVILLAFFGFVIYVGVKDQKNKNVKTAGKNKGLSPGDF